MTSFVLTISLSDNSHENTNFLSTQKSKIFRRYCLIDDNRKRRIHSNIQTIDSDFINEWWLSSVSRPSEMHSYKLWNITWNMTVHSPINPDWKILQRNDRFLLLKRFHESSILLKEFGDQFYSLMAELKGIYQNREPDTTTGCLLEAASFSSDFAGDSWNISSGNIVLERTRR